MQRDSACVAQAPMLYCGEKIGTGLQPAVDIAVDPLDGTTLISQASSVALDNRKILHKLMCREQQTHAADQMIPLMNFWKLMVFAAASRHLRTESSCWQHPAARLICCATCLKVESLAELHDAPQASPQPACGWT